MSKSAPAHSVIIGHYFSWRRRGPLDPSKSIGKMSIFCFGARLGRTQGDMICITSAIRRLYAVLGVHFSLSGHCLPLFSWKLTPKWLQFDILKHKNVRIPSHRASQKLSRRSFGSKLNFVVSILYFSMGFYGFPWIQTQKTAEYLATRHEIKHFSYQTTDLFKPRRLKYTRESETPK